MRLGSLRSEQGGQPQHLSRVSRLSAFEIEQAEVQEQLPIVEAEADRFLILGEFLAMLADDAVRETQMIVCERVAGIVVDHYAMTADCFRIIFHAQKIVSQRIANLLIVRTVFGARARADRRLEYQRDQSDKTNARTPKAQQLIIPSRTRDSRGKKFDGSRNFRHKKTRSAFCNAARSRKGVVPAALRINPGSRDRPNAGGKAKLCPPTLNGSKFLRRFETGRPLRAVALSNYPSSCYGLAGGAMAGDASAAGDAIAPSLLAAAALW